MPARLGLSWGMKTLKLFLLPVLESFEFGWQVIRYALIFVSAFFEWILSHIPMTRIRRANSPPI
jgi:hypothetical protein